MADKVFPTGISTKASPVSSDKLLIADSEDSNKAKVASIAEIATIITPDVSGKEDKANKGIAGGYASLDGSGKVPASQLPAVASGVASVNGKSGVVVLVPSDIGAATSDQGSTADSAVQTISAGTNVSVSRVGNSVTINATGTGDVSSNTSSSVDSEIALFSGTGGKTIKRSTTTGILKGTSGVLSSAVSGTDYVSPTGTETLTNKTLALGSNTVSGTAAQFNTACTDADFAFDTATQEADRTVIALAASTANLTLSGTQTVDGISLVAGDYCLAKNQSTSSQNGVYVVAAGSWTRATEYSTTADFNKKEVYVSSGTTNGGTWWLCATRNVVVGTTATTFSQVPNGIGTAADQSAAGNHTHTSITATGASSFSNTLLASGAFTNGAALLKRYTSRTATASTAATDNVVVMSGSTAAQIETMPSGVAVSNSSGRVVLFVNNASVDWTIRQASSNTLNGSSADFTLKAGRWMEVFNTALNTWVISGYGLNGTEASAGGGSAFEATIQDYKGLAMVGILGQFDATTSKTLAEVTIISDSLPVGSNLICELRKNSTSSGNILSSTLQVTTTESATNGRYVGTPVTSFTSAAIADGDVLYAVLTGVGSTTPAINARVILRFSA